MVFLYGLWKHKKSGVDLLCSLSFRLVIWVVCLVNYTRSGSSGLGKVLRLQAGVINLLGVGECSFKVGGHCLT